MIETPHIVQTEHVLAAVIKLTTPREEIRNVMEPTLNELRAPVMDQGVKITGPWFTHHSRLDPKVFDLAIGVPVASPVSDLGRVKTSSLPAARVARAVYHGGYECLPDAWPELQGWIAAKGERPAADLWEVYLVGPETENDPSAWRTQPNRPLSVVG